MLSRPYDPTVREIKFNPDAAALIAMNLAASKVTTKELDKLTGGFSAPSKMPGLSFNLPALVTCKIGAILAKQEGTVCSGCYALKGRYAFPATQEALDRRLSAVRELDRWAAAMALRISKYKGDKAKWFRFHDSGDIVSLGHLRAIAWVARQCPETKFWLPTREVQLVREYTASWPIPENLCIRVSGMRINAKAPEIKHAPEVAYSAVHSDEVPAGYSVCPAPKQEGKCGDCRSCWDPSTLVSYHVH